MVFPAPKAADLAKLRPKIAIPEPCSYDAEYSNRSLPAYLEAVESAGGEAVVIPLGLPPDDLAKRIGECSAVLLPGSKADIDPQKFNEPRHPKTAPADPERDAADELLLQDAYNLHKPILGICYGLQSLNVWRGGSLVQDIESKTNHSAKGVEVAHRVAIEGGTRIGKSMEGCSSASLIPVNSSHHQSANRVGDGLRIAARCVEDQTIEAIEGTFPEHYVVAVQWHPERSFEKDVCSQRLFQSLIEAASAWRALSQKVETRIVR